MVAISLFIITFWALAGKVAVGQKLLLLNVIVLLAGALLKKPLFKEFFEEHLSRFVVNFMGSARVNVKRNAQLRHGLFDYLMVFIYNGPGGGAFFAGAHGNGHAVFV